MWSVAENDRYALTEDKCCGRPKRCNAMIIRGGGTRCQRNEIDGFGGAYVACFEVLAWSWGAFVCGQLSDGEVVGEARRGRGRLGYVRGGNRERLLRWCGTFRRGGN